MKKRLVILGTGFASMSLIRGLRMDAYDVTIISPRNHFLFTPLLPSTTVGTIEFRSIIEPIRSQKNIRFIQAYARDIDDAAKTVLCDNAVDGKKFEMTYDFLLIAVGAVNNTFGVPGVNDHAFFLKELRDARRIRQRIIDNFEQAATPTLSPEERSRLLHFVVVGGGPTGVEFAAELSDFMQEELAHSYSDLIQRAYITLIEGGKNILNSFDERLSHYATTRFARQNVNLMTRKLVKKVTHDTILLDDGNEIYYGMLVWSTGNGPAELIRSLPFQKDSTSRILTDEFCRVLSTDVIYAAGDCANVQGHNFPATAQLAMQQGKYLAKHFNALARQRRLKSFTYKHLGMLAYIGDNRAIADLPKAKSGGISTWLFWRSAYLTRLVSLKNKVLVLFDWFKAALFGRDVSRF